MKKIVKILVFLSVILFLGINNISAKQVIRLKECEYTEEYKKWLKLSDKEKEKVLMPQMCKTDNVGSTLNTNVSSTLGSITQSKFDLRNVNGRSYVTSIKDQTVTGSCWAFATNASLESNMLVNGLGEYDLSETHLELSTQNTFPIANRTNFNRVFSQGGNQYISSAYLFNRRGSVLESKYPHSISENLVNSEATTYDTTTLAKEKPMIDLGGVAIINKASGTKCGKDNATTEQMKQYLVTHGALFATMNFDLNGLGIVSCDSNMESCVIKSNSLNGPYHYYNGALGSNHAVTIIGWDDTISKDNFNEDNKPTSDGAWIVKNSYGEYIEIEEAGEKVKLLMGDKGYFYISYEDTRICESLAGFYDADTTLDDNNYSHAELGVASKLSTSSDELYIGAVYEKNNTSNQKINKVTFFVEKPGMDYEVYFASNGSLSNLTKVATGNAEYAGYETVYLTNNNISNSDRSSVVVKYTKVGYSTYVPVSIKTDSDIYWDENVIKNDATYLSFDMESWADTSEGTLGDNIAPFNNVIYVYTDNIDSTVTTTKTTTSSTTKTTTSSTTKSTTSSSNSSTTSTTRTTQPVSTTKKEEDKPNEDAIIVIEPNEKNDGTIIDTEKPEKNPSTSQSDVSFVLVLGIMLLGFVGLSILKLRKLKD